MCIGAHKGRDSEIDVFVASSAKVRVPVLYLAASPAVAIRSKYESSCRVLYFRLELGRDCSIGR